MEPTLRKSMGGTTPDKKETIGVDLVKSAPQGPCGNRQSHRVKVMKIKIRVVFL